MQPAKRRRVRVWLPQKPKVKEAKQIEEGEELDTSRIHPPFDSSELQGASCLVDPEWEEEMEEELLVKEEEEMEDELEEELQQKTKKSRKRPRTETKTSKGGKRVLTDQQRELRKDYYLSTLVLSIKNGEVTWRTEKDDAKLKILKENGFTDNQIKDYLSNTSRRMRKKVQAADILRACISPPGKRSKFSEEQRELLLQYYVRCLKFSMQNGATQIRVDSDATLLRELVREAKVTSVQIKDFVSNTTRKLKKKFDILEQIKKFLT